MICAWLLICKIPFILFTVIEASVVDECEVDVENNCYSDSDWECISINPFSCVIGFVACV